MDSLANLLAELERKGSAQTRKTYARHGIAAPMFGVSVAELKKLVQRVRGDQPLALALYDTGNYDAQYLAGLAADAAGMSKPQLNRWAKTANCHAICSTAVAWVAAESPHGRELAMKWIASTRESLGVCGWTTYAGIVATQPDEELDLPEVRNLLRRAVAEIDDAANRVRYAMNSFVISVGGYVKPLHAEAKKAARQLGQVEVDMGDTACKTPLATAYIDKIAAMGRVGKKRKTMRC